MTYGRTRILALVITSAAASACGGAGAMAPETSTPRAAPLGIDGEHHPRPGITTGGVPTIAVIHAAGQAGYRTVVSLQLENETSLANEEEAVGFRRMRFVRIPVEGEAGLTEQNARALGELTSDPDSMPILLHCSSANRAGALLALAAYYTERMPVEEALELGRAAGLERLEPSVRAHLERAEAGRAVATSR